MMRIHQREPGFEELNYRSHQIYFVNEFAQRNNGHALLLCQLSRAFECDAARVNAALKSGFDDPQGRGRHSALDDASEIEILEWIQKQAESLIQPHRPTFSTTAKLNILVLFPEGGSILLFCDIEKI
jgi:hypothetical protein